MAVPIAELFVSVGADVSAAVAGLTALGVQLDSTAAKFQTAAPAALLLEAGAAGVGLALFDATKVAASFEQAMADVRAVMTPSEAEQFGAALGDLAIQLGQSTVFSAREAAAGIGELIRAGIPAADVLGGAAQAALNLAAATGIPVANAATVAAQTMNAFHKSAADLTGVVDTLAGTANATAANMSDLQFGLQVVSATAQTMGLSFEDTTAAIGVFVSAGETGATAGTGLRQMLLELIPTTKPAKDEMLKLGLTTKDGGNAFFDAAGHVKSLAQISGTLQTALRGMSDEQRIAALNTLFTRDAINSASILASQGAEGVNKLTGEIAKISAADTAATRLGTLQGAMNNLGSSLETVQIIVGNLFLPKLRELADTVRGLVDRFSNLSPEQQKTIVLFTGLAGVVAGLVGSFVLLRPFIIALGPSFQALGQILLTASVPLRLLALAATGLFIAWQTDLGGIRGIAENAFSKIPELFDKVTTLFGQARTLWEEQIVPVFEHIRDAVLEKLKPAFDSIGTVLGLVLTGHGGEVLDFFKTLLPQAFKDLGTALEGPVGEAFGFIERTFTQILTGHGGDVLDFFKTLLPQAFKDLGASLEGPVGQAFGAIETIFGLIVSGKGGEALTFFKQLLPQAFKDLGASLEGPVGTTFGAIATIFDLLVHGHGQEALDFFKQGLPQAFKDLGASIEAPITNVFSTIGTLFTAIVRGDGQLVLDFFSAQLPQALKDFASKVDPEGIALPLLRAIADIETAIGSLTPEKIQNVSALFSGALLASLKNFGDQLAPLAPVFQSVGSFFASVANVFAAFAELRARQAAAAGAGEAEDPLVSSLQRLVDFVAKNGDFKDHFLLFFGPIGAALEGVAKQGDSTAAFFNNLADALNKFAEAVRTLPELPDWLQKALGANTIQGAALAAGQQVGSNAAGGLVKDPNVPGGVGVHFNAPITINTPVELDQFIQRVAEAISGSTKRVNTPPDNSAHPALVPAQ